MRFNSFTIILFNTCLIISIICQNIENIVSNVTQNSTIDSIDNSIDFEDFDEQNKVLLNLNQNCSTHEDCNAKHSVCDMTYNTCECDLSSMQTNMKCRTIYCHSSDECLSRFGDSSCTFGRCQCLSARKFNGKCIQGLGIGMLSSTPLPDWAIISIAVTLALSVIAGGSLKKRQLRQQLMKMIRLLLFRDENNRNSDSSNDSDINTKESQV